jgi:hypothetical protein
MFQSAFDLISNKLYPYFWRFRHLWSPGWPESYLYRESVNQSHRRILCDEIAKMEPFDSIMEYGCGPGANLLWFARQFPFAKIEGMDISRKAVNYGKQYFMFFPNVHITTDESILAKGTDVFVTDAALIYNAKPDPFLMWVKSRVSRGYVGCEWHSDCDKSLTFGRHWVHNYRKLFPGCEVQKLKWDVPDEGWDTYGHIITWRK